MSNFIVKGTVRYAPALKPISNGRNLLPLSIEDENGFIPVVVFSPLAETLAQQLGQGMQVSLSGRINAKKDPQSGYWYSSLIANKYSLDGTNWVDESQCQQQQPLQQVIQGFQQPQQQPVRTPAQQSQAFQQPQVNQQVQHLQQCQSQFEQQAPQQHQRQPAQQQQQPKQSRDEFLSTNQYRQQPATGQQQQGKMADLLNNRTDPDSPVTPEAMEAQSQLYSAPAQGQQQ